MVWETIKTRMHKLPNQIDTQEAFSLWDILTSKYHETERLLILQHFAHDKDLKLIIKHYIKELNENINILKRELNRYQIPAPTPNREIGPPPCNIEMFTDEFIASEALLYAQEHIENLLRTLRMSMTNDEIRHTISKMTKETIDREAQIVDYMTLKGWIKMCPRYHGTPANVREKLSAAEAYHIWDHLCFRYDNIQQTRLYLALAHDIDFKLVLEEGLRQLTTQAKMLEKEIRHFGIVAPQKPTDVTIRPGETDILADSYMYRMVLIGLQGASIVHAQSIKQCTFNSRIREIFKRLLMKEIDTLGRYIKFGKLKGWVNTPPAYVPGS